MSYLENHKSTVDQARLMERHEPVNHDDTPDPMDHFIGRTVLGSEGFIEDLQTYFPTCETLHSGGLLVVPVMQRHMLGDHSMANASQLLERIQTLSRLPQGRSVTYVRDAIARQRQRGDGSKKVVYLRTNPKRSPNYDLPQFTNDRRIVCSLLKMAFNEEPFKIRVAEAERMLTAEHIIDLLRTHHLAKGTVRLSPLQVCEAQKKS